MTDQNWAGSVALYKRDLTIDANVPLRHPTLAFSDAESYPVGSR